MRRRAFVTGLIGLPFWLSALNRDCSQAQGDKTMALKKFGFIVTGSGLDPARHRMVMASDSFAMIAVGVSEASEGVEVATAMVADGVQLIELCGGFGPVGTARVLDAIGGAVPVGSVGYGPESIDAMYELFAPDLS